MIEYDDKQLKSNIERLRDELTELIGRGDNLTSEEILKLSKELDELINKYREASK